MAYSQPFTTEQLFKDLGGEQGPIGRATVYRTVDLLLADHWLARVHWSPSKEAVADDHAYVPVEQGHQHHMVCNQCGAVAATVEEVMGTATIESSNLRSIVQRVRPSVETLLSGRDAADLPALMDEAVRANVRASANHLRHGSELLERLIKEDGLLVVGADYSLDSGIVSFFDGVDEAD